MSRTIRRGIHRTAWICGGLSVLLLICISAYGRTWTLVSGETVEAEYVRTTLKNVVVLKQSDGTQLEILSSKLSAEDHDYIALTQPPRLDIEFGDGSKVETLDSSDRFLDNPSVIQETISFNVRIKQTSPADYSSPLTVEYFAIGYQYQDQDKYVLLKKGVVEFVLNEENKRSFRHDTEPMKLPLEFTLETHYGQKYCDYLVMVVDLRGEVIASRSTKNWLIEHADKLKELPEGAFFNDSCTRVHASGPKPLY